MPFPVRLPRPPAGDLIICARNEEEIIPAMLRHAIDLGYNPDNVVIMVNGSTDNTAQVCDEFGIRASVMEDFLARHGSLMDQIAQRFGVDPRNCSGKGLAIWSATLGYGMGRYQPTNPLFFLDADIDSARQTNPFGALHRGWMNRHDSGGRMIKLAQIGEGGSQTRDLPVRQILGDIEPRAARLRWPTCGQLAISLGDLQRMRLPVGYTVECSEVPQMIAMFGASSIVEMEIRTVLRDATRTEDAVDGMHARIKATLKACGDIQNLDLPCYNASAVTNGAIDRSSHPHDTGRPEAVLPSIAELREAHLL